jgi:hypothetical protein
MAKKNARGLCLAGVMAHQKFGDVVIDRPSEGVCIYIPQNQIVRRGRRAGQPKKNVAARLNCELTEENIMALRKDHVIVLDKASANMTLNLDGGVAVESRR